MPSALTYAQCRKAWTEGKGERFGKERMVGKGL